MSSKGSSLHTLTYLLVIIGGLNWLLVGLFNWDIGQIFGGQGAIISKIIYILVGLSAIYEMSVHKKICKQCEKMGASKNAGTDNQPSGSDQPQA